MLRKKPEKSLISIKNALTWQSMLCVDVNEHQNDIKKKTNKTRREYQIDFGNKKKARVVK